MPPDSDRSTGAPRRLDDTALARLVSLAQDGDRAALERVVSAVQDDVHGLALRMLWHPEDAADASQEILIRVVTHLGGFRGASRFRTWVYRVASNYLLTTRRRRAEQDEVSFDEFGADLAEGLADSLPWAEAPAERRVLIEEVKIGCTHGMLLCLDRDHRLAYILSDILELTGPEGAAVLEVTPTAFRKRVSRARERLHRFMRDHCGLVRTANRCRCDRRVDAAIQSGRVDPDRLLFARRNDASTDAVLAGTRAVEDLHEAVAAVYRSHPPPVAPAAVADRIRSLLASTRFRPLTD